MKVKDFENFAKREGTGNIIKDGAFAFFLIVGVLTLPGSNILNGSSVLTVLPTTQAYFHFGVIETDHPSNKSGSVADGYIKLSGIGGLSADNKLTLELRMVLYRNSTDTSINGTTINNPTSILFSPQFGETPATSVNLSTPPKPFVLTLDQANDWTTSLPIEFFASGPQGVQLTFLDSNIPAPPGVAVGTPAGVQFSYPSVIQISDESVYVSAINDEYTLALSFFVIALICYEVRSEKKEDPKPVAQAPRIIRSGKAFSPSSRLSSSSQT